MKACYLMMDIGGTGMKVALFDREGRQIGTRRRFDAKAKASAEVIFANLAFIIRTMADGAEHRRIDGIGMAFPGPFDYQQGISLMQGLDKYDSIYGLSIREGVLEQLKKTDPRVVSASCRFLFLHDIEAFAIGAWRYGVASECSRVLCLCIGTGAGSAFLEQGQIIRKASEAVPENGWIYCMPYRDGVIDDYVSARGLRRTAEQLQLTEAGIDGERLYQLAASGDDGARKVFALFGEDVRAALEPFLVSFRPDGLVLGGQIAKSFRYFGNSLRGFCDVHKIRIILEADTSARTVEGLCAAWHNTMKGTKR